MTIQKPVLNIIFMFAMILPGLTWSQTLEDDKKAIDAVSKARAEAFNRGNSEGIAKYFTQDAVLMAPRKTAAIGKEAVKTYYQGIFDEFEVQLDSHYEEIKVSGDMAYGRGEAVVRLVPKDGGKSAVTSSKYLNILKRQPDGNWKTTHDIWNDNEGSP